MSDSIVLRIVDGIWMAESCGPHAVEVVRLFGTNVLPTAFTVATPGEAVLKVMSRLSPGYAVRLGS